MSAQEEIQKIIDKFRAKVEADPEMKKEVAAINKTLNLDLGTEQFSMELKDADVIDFVPRLRENADINVTTTVETFQALLDGSLRPMKAYITKKVRIKGDLNDVMALKKFL